MSTELPTRELEKIVASDSQRKARLLTLDDLADLPEPRYLLHDFIRASGTNVLYGPAAAEGALPPSTGVPA